MGAEETRPAPATGAPLPDSNGRGRQGQREQKHLGELRPSRREPDGLCYYGGLDRAPFPPPPDDTRAWARILKEFPHLAPAIEPGVCELVDGLASVRNGLLRTLGNGVVPLQAAYAFSLLATRLFLVPDEDIDRLPES